MNFQLFFDPILEYEYIPNICCGLPVEDRAGLLKSGLGDGDRVQQDLFEKEFLSYSFVTVTVQ